MARPEGFEPPTPAFVAQYSIQMNYGRVLNLRVVPPRYWHHLPDCTSPDRLSVRHLGSIQRSLRYRPLQFPAGWELNPFAFY